MKTSFPDSSHLPCCRAETLSSKTILWREFSSWYEFVTCVADPALRAWKTPRLKSQTTSNSSWAGTSTFKAAIDMALRTGWPDGRKLLSEMLVSVRQKTETFKSLSFDVAGMFPCVALYNAGDPACMFSDSTQYIRAANPIIRIDFNHNASGFVSSSDIMLRGAAVVSLAQSLEASDLNVEINMIGNVACGSTHILRYSAPFKRADESLDLDRAAFAIAHPSTLRRLAFALYEQHPELESLISTSYGSPIFSPHDTNPNTITIPNSTGHETPATARAAVQAAASSLLTSLEESENV